jgi:acetylornithine deacetylase/succinyl-diaminopimelate desuccinylase-like protein
VVSFDGRGALDMKSLAIAQFVSMLALKRSKSRLARDVIFLGTADEEAGGELGAGWFVKNHPELLGDAEYLLNEGGGNVITPDGRLVAVGLSPAEKSPAWLKLTAVAEPVTPQSHGQTRRSIVWCGRSAG